MSHEEPLVGAEAKARRLEALSQLLDTVDRLRDPGGCPWDREQSVESMAPYVVEEAHELAEAVEEKSERDTVKEAGDVLMVVCMIARIAQEEGRFDLADCAAAINEKLIRRHPHVFGETDVADSGEVLSNWERIKKEERQEAGEDDSALAGVPKSLPAMQRAERLSQKAVQAGFHWDDWRGALLKVAEEVTELDEALRVDGGPNEEGKLEGEARERVEAELGDVLIAGAFLGQYLSIDPERAAKRALDRFEARFRSMEGAVDGPLSDHDLSTLMQAWQDAKRATS